MSTWKADDGSEIYFESFGGKDKNKPTLLLLPGLLGAIRTQWRNFIQPLNSEFRILLVDLRGHGKSTNEGSNLRPEKMVEDIFGLLDDLKIDQLHVMGYSLGGYLGMLMAYTEPLRVKSLVAHATKFYWTDEAIQRMKAQLDPDMMAEKVPTYADLLVQDHGARQWRLLVRQAADMIIDLKTNGLTEAMARKIQCPTLISVGEKDELVNILEAQRLSAVLPKGELIVLPGVKHPFQTVRFMPLLPMAQHFFLSS
ncbi:MAG: alpha/beta hydrolase [Chloroflexota bacterium]